MQSSVCTILCGIAVESRYTIANCGFVHWFCTDELTIQLFVCKLVEMFADRKKSMIL